MAWRLGVDIGGTFTDFVAVDTRSRDVVVLKLPSTKASPAAAVLDGLRRLESQESLASRDIEYLAHGSTVATNALIERDGVAVGLLVTRGLEDLLVMGRLELPNGPDLQGQMLPPLAPRRHVRGIVERISAKGEILLPLSEAEVVAAARELRSEGIRSVAICFLHSYAFPEHERRAKESIVRELPDMRVWASSDIWPEIREYERALVTTLNAYLGGDVSQYFLALESNARSLGMQGPVLISQGNGGLATPSSAASRPVFTVQSGPAAGVAGAVHVARGAGFERIMTLDMGGTSTDVAVVDGAVPIANETMIGGIPIILPLVEVSSIGAGGGSIAWVDPAGVLKVGPQSAGSTPGPACYGRGGDRPTLTDAYLCTGIIGEEAFAGGDIHLDRGRAVAALAALKFAGRSPEETAEGIIEIITAELYASAVRLFARKGVDLREFALTLYGGAGPTHGFLLARELGIRTVIVPAAPGLLCALGCLAMDVRSDFVRTVNVRLAPSDRSFSATLRHAHSELLKQADLWLSEQQVGKAWRSYALSADMRYRGQSYSLTVPLSDSELGDYAALCGAFHVRHLAAFAHNDENAGVDVVSVRVAAVGETERPPTALPTEQSSGTRTGVPARSRRILLDGRWSDVPVYRRSELRIGQGLPGPAVIEQYDTTTLVPSGFSLRLDDHANLIGELRQ